MLQTLQLVVRCFQALVGDQQHIGALLNLDLGDLRAFFIQQERCDFHRHLRVHRGGVVLHGLLLDDAQNLQRRTFGVTHMTRSAAAWARNGCTFTQCGAQTLRAHLHQAKFADGAKLHTRTVLSQRIAQTVFHFAAVFGLVHVNEVNDDQAAQVAQTHLTSHFVGGLQVGAGGGFFDVTALDGARRVDVHRHQGLGVVDDDRAARGQVDRAGIGRLDLMLDLKAREQRRFIAVALHTGCMFGHDMRHELLSLVVNVVGVDQDVADVIVEIVADGANHQAGFLVNQEGAFG